MRLDQKKPIDFYWFSGSGNTLYIVKAVARFLVSRGFEVTLKPIEASDPADVDLRRTVGLGIPVAEQGTFPLIWDFIKNFPSPFEQGVMDADVFMVDTLMLYSGGIKGPLKKILKSKGFHPLGAKEIRMPNILMKMKYQPDRDRMLMEKGKNAAEKFARNLVSGKAVWADIPFYSDLMSIFSRKEYFWNIFRKSFPLHVDNGSCTRCGLCERICPVQNWSFDGKENRMQWSGNCIFCLRCFSYCPEGAISYGKRDYLRHKALNVVDFLLYFLK